VTTLPAGAAVASARFDARLAAHGASGLTRRSVTTVQVNLGRLCNQICRHCHVDAGPNRKELMDEATVARLLAVLDNSPAVRTVDLTGGAPELNPRFRGLVDAVVASGRSVMVRCNLTVVHEPGQGDLPQYYAERGVHVVASLPCYTAENTDRQRGGGVFDKSIESLRALNAAGYGAAQGKLDPDVDAPRLDLVFNPGGPSLPPPQEALEADYRARLAEDFGIVFDRLLTLANLPVHRFAEDLARDDRLDGYLDLLEASFNPEAADAVMCRDLVSVGWDGRIADCDFHLVLGVPTGSGRATLFDLDSFEDLARSPITTADHCLGCTAGQGSSCGGSLVGDGAP
jgi:radical SAM/Cys-rich protein